MTTALANVSDDWVQRAFAEELGGGVKHAGGNVLKENLKDVFEIMKSSLPALIMVFLLWNYIAIISIVATPKRKGSTKGLGVWAIIASIIEIALGLGGVFMARHYLDAKNFDIGVLLLASIFCGLFIAILLLLSKLKPGLDVFFNTIRIVCFTLLYLFTANSFVKYKNVYIGLSLVMAGSLCAVALMKPSQKTAIGVLSFFSVLFMVAMFAMYFVAVF